MKTRISKDIGIITSKNTEIKILSTEMRECATRFNQTPHVHHLCRVQHCKPEIPDTCQIIVQSQECSDQPPFFFSSSSFFSKAWLYQSPSRQTRAWPPVHAARAMIRMKPPFLFDQTHSQERYEDKNRVSTSIMDERQIVGKIHESVET